MDSIWTDPQPFVFLPYYEWCYRNVRMFNCQEKRRNLRGKSPDFRVSEGDMEIGGAKGVVVERVLAAYGLAGATVERITGGFINQTFRVQDGAQTYALRRHRRENRDFIAREHLVMLAAGEAGVPTPTIIPTCSGEPVSEADGALWSLLTWLPGEAMPASRLDGLLAYRLGQALARAHQALGRLDTRLFPGRPSTAALSPTRPWRRWTHFHD